jgi:hypothetical protein
MISGVRRPRETDEPDPDAAGSEDRFPTTEDLLAVHAAIKDSTADYHNERTVEDADRETVQLEVGCSTQLFSGERNKVVSLATPDRAISARHDVLVAMDDQEASYVESEALPLLKPWSAKFMGNEVARRLLVRALHAFHVANESHIANDGEGSTEADRDMAIRVRNHRSGIAEGWWPLCGPDEDEPSAATAALLRSQLGGFFEPSSETSECGACPRG